MHEFDEISKCASEVLGKQPPSLIVPRLLTFLDSYVDCLSTSPQGDKPPLFQFETVTSASLATRSTVTLSHTIAVHGVAIEPLLLTMCWSILNALSHPTSCTNLVSWDGCPPPPLFKTHISYKFWSNPSPSIPTLSLICTTILLP